MARRDRVAELTQQARAHEARRNFDRAAQAYDDLTRLENNNPRWAKKAGECHRLAGNSTRAIKSFQEAAEINARLGFLLKAIALCKLVLSIQPSHKETQEMLAGLYSSQGGGGGSAAGDSESLDEPEAEEAPSRPRPSSGDMPGFAFAEPMPMLEVMDFGEETAVEDEPPPPEPPPPEPPPPEPPPPEPPPPEPPPPEPPPPEPPPPEPPPPEPPAAPVDEEDSSAPIEAGENPEDALPLLEFSLDDMLLPELDVAAETPPGPSETLADTLPPVPLFSSLEKPALRDLIEKVKVLTCDAGEHLIREGEKGDLLYVVVEGEVQVYRPGPPRVDLSRLGEGSFFGEIALLSNRQRTASVVTLDKATLLTISRDVIRDLLARHPESLKVLLRFFRERLIHTLVETHRIFASFSEEERRNLVERFSFMEAKSGSPIITEGESPDGLYILLSGDASVLQGEKSVTVLSGGSLIGDWESIIRGDASTFGVEAMTKCWLLKMDRSKFMEVIMTHGAILEVLGEESQSYGKQEGKGPSQDDPFEESALPLL